MTAQYKPGPWRFRPITEHDNGGRITALLLETQMPDPPLHDRCVLAIRDDWMGWLVRDPRGQATARVVQEAPELHRTLRALVDWAREHTSPRDTNSPHDLLVDACAVLARVEEG